MERNKGFIKALNKLKSKAQLMNARATEIGRLYDSGDLLAAYEQALILAVTTERATLLSRALPAYTGNPNAYYDIENVILSTVPVSMGYTEEGWFLLQMPLLLPKKSDGSVDYIRSFLYPAMANFFTSRPPVRYTDCVLIYRHVYDRKRPERQKRDHDNIEINMVSDVVALYVMPDDGPSVCSHYYTSAAGDSERTEVYVVPKQDFTRWLEIEKTIPEDGLILLENKP